MDDWKSRLVVKSMLPHFTMVGDRQEPRKLQESPQGTIKRRQEGDNFQLSGMADGGYPNKIKRPCLEDVTLSMGSGAHPSTSCAELQVPALAMNPSPAAMGAAGHSLLLENNPMNGSVMGSPFVVPPTAEMSLKGPPLPYYDKTNSMPAVDQELQDLLEELTRIQEPSPSELDLEKILGSKPEEPLILDHPPATLGMTPKPPSVQMPPLESLGSSKEFASSCSQVTSVSLQIPPSSAGISYVIPATGKQMVSPSSLGTQAKKQAQAMLPAALPPLPVPQWHHAHQLKALAASKQGSTTKQPGPTTSWPGLPPPGLSPPYRPVPSPHPPQPFSSPSLMVSCMSSSSLPGSALQGSPNALLSSVAPSSSTALGPTLPYAPEKLPSPALHQRPQFSPQSSILANLVSSTIKNPQGHLMSALPTSTPGPATPYRPEKLSSPGLPQQSFSPQCSLIRSLTPTSNPLSQPPPLPPPQQQQANSIFKPMATHSPKTLSMIMQQGLTSPGPGAPEPFTFGDTKPLSHFLSEPGPQKTPSVPAASRQPSLLHYLQQPTLTQASSATASSTATATLRLPQQPDQSSFLLQQMMQQPQRFPRSVASEAMPSLPRQACCHLFSWTSAAGSGERQHQPWNSYPSRQDPQPGDVSASNITHVDKACKLGEARPPQVSLGRQPPSCQAVGSESFLPGSSFAQELARVTSSYGTSEAAPWGGWDPKAWRQVPAPLLPSCDAVAVRGHAHQVIIPGLPGDIRQWRLKGDTDRAAWPGLPQEKQRSGLMAMTPEQQSAYVAQQMSQFQAVQDQVTSKCSRTKASSPSSQYLMPPRAGLLQNHPSPEMIPPTRHQSHESVGMISPTLGKQQGIFNSSPPFPIPSPSGHTPLGSLGSICQHRQIPEAVPGFCPSPLGSQPLSPHQLRQPSVPRMPTVFNNAAWVAAAAAATPAVLRAPPPSQAANGIHQHFDNNSIFAKAPMRAPLGAPAFPSHQAGVPPSQVAPGGRPGPKVSAAPAKPSFSLLGTQNLRQSPVWGPVPMLNTTKSLHESMASFGPMSPIRGIKLPIYMAAAATAATASTIATSQCPGPVDRMGSPPGLPPCGIWSQPPLNDLISPPDCSEVDFTEAGSKGPRGSPEEDWVCNLRLIDDILEQHAAARNAAARSTGHIAPSAGEL